MKLGNETILSLREIARAWAQDSGTHTEAVIFEHLVHAFLSDEFAPLATDTTWTAACNRRLALQTWAEVGKLPGHVIDVMDRRWTALSKATRPRPHLLRFKHCAVYADRLKKVPLTAWPSFTVQHLGNLKLHRDVLLDWCAFRGIDPPRFWAAHLRRPKATAGATARFKCWLADQIAQRRTWAVREACWAEAKALFPNLSQRGFADGWSQLAPPTMKRPGRRPTASR
jgi:hypothetical protein